MLSRQGRETEIVQHQKFGHGQAPHKFPVASVVACEIQILHEGRQPVVGGGDSLPTGAVGECAGEPGFARSGGSGDQEVVASLNPMAGSEACQERTVDAAARPGVEIFEGGVLAEFCPFQAIGELPVLPLQEFRVDEEGHPVLEGKVMDFGVLRLSPLAMPARRMRFSLSMVG